MATRMRAGAPDDGARAPRPMFTGHAAAIVGVCLRGGQPNIFPNNNCAACKCRWGTSKAAAPMRLGMPGTELRPGADRAATWKRGGSALFSAENDRLVSCWYCWYFSREKAASERVLPYFPRTKLGSRTQQTVRALQNLYCSGQPMPWGYLCYHYIV